MPALDMIARRWIAAWVATGLVVAQIILLIALGAGSIRWLRYLGWVLWIVAAFFGWWPVYEFKRRGGVARGDSYVKTTQLVDSGLYGIVRHPQFVAWPLMSAAVALVSQQPVVIALGGAAFVLSSLEFRHADARNVEKFGEEYQRYMDRVPGWNFAAGMWRWARRRARPVRSGSQRIIRDRRSTTAAARSSQPQPVEDQVGVERGHGGVAR